MANALVSRRGGGRGYGGGRAESREGRGAEIATLVLFAMAAFCVAALMTFSPDDPSYFSNAGAANPRNACGRIGALVASLGLECLGIASFLIPAGLFVAAAAVHRREGGARLAGTAAGMAVAVLALTVFLALQWKYWPFGGTLVLTGGILGAWAANGLLGELNLLGASIVSACGFLVAIVVATPLSVARIGAAALGLGFRVSWRLARLAGTYLAYLLGLVAMRGAHLLGDGLQGLMESAARRARARADAKKTAAKKPLIDVKAEVEAEVEDAEEIEAAPVAAAEAPRDPKRPVAVPVAIGLEGAEAPNALPELGQGGKAAVAAAAKRAKGLTQPPLFEIVPPEPAATPAITADAAKRAAEKLAAAAARGAKRGQWKLPSLDFLRPSPRIESSYDESRLRQNAETLTRKFADFDIGGQVVAVRPGPVITLYEFKPDAGIKVSRIAAMADDLSMALSAQSVRILAPLPGKPVVGIEIPSEKRQTVYFREFLEHPDFREPGKHTIPVVMGKDIAGQPYLSDLTKMPHLLCAGQTGSGKSVFMNGLICSLLYRFTPDELRLVLVDPKFIEFRAYQDIPHLLLPVVDDARHASTALKWAVREMERRYRILAMMGARNLAAYNQKVEDVGADVVSDLLLSEENRPQGIEKMAGGDWIEAFEHDATGAPRIGKLPYIVVIIDELADLMMIAKKDVEISIARIAQKARAAGVHLVIATQRPSTDVITGLIKANLPSRASFQLASHIDSRTILDRQGAERLLGQGDMLFIPPGTAQLNRLHGAYLDDGEIAKITAFLKEQGKPVYRDEILIDEEEDSEDADDGDQDELFDEALEIAKRSGQISTSSLQRHMKIGYNRAARIIDMMESRGFVGPADGARPREVLAR